MQRLKCEGMLIALQPRPPTVHRVIAHAHIYARQPIVVLPRQRAVKVLSVPWMCVACAWGRCDTRFRVGKQIALSPQCPLLSVSVRSVAVGELIGSIVLVLSSIIGPIEWHIVYSTQIGL